VTKVSLERRRAFRWLLVPAMHWALPAWGDAARIASARLWPAEEYTRIIFEAPTPIESQLVVLRDPNRLVLDLARVDRSRDLDALPSQLGLERVESVAPVMAEQFHVFFPDAESAQAGQQRIASARVGDQPLFEAKLKGNEVFVGCLVFSPQPEGATVTLAPTGSVSLDELLYWSPAPRQGTHHPDGVFWIGNGTTSGSEPHVPLVDIAPTILSLLGVDRPSTMTEPPLVLEGATA